MSVWTLFENSKAFPSYVARKAETTPALLQVRMYGKLSAW